MKAYRFETKVSKNGAVNLPIIPDFHNMVVEVIILPKKENYELKTSGKEFIAKWAGFLENDNKDDFKYNYLIEKYK